MVIAFVVAPLMILTGWLTGNGQLVSWGILVGLVASIAAAVARSGSRPSRRAER